MTAIKEWNNWTQTIDNETLSEVNDTIISLEKDISVPFVEKNLKLGYLYFVKDQLGKATNIFHNVVSVITKEAMNTIFKKENEKGLNILYMGFRIVPDGCGGFDIFETGDCCGEGCGPICGCIGIAAIMAFCGIEASDITTCDSTDGQGCLDNCLNSCCGVCEECGLGC